MKTKEILRKERGITLVALIITIIVLIILAAVSINAVLKTDFIGLATNGTINYAEAQVNEQKQMDDLNDKLDNVIARIEKVSSPETFTGYTVWKDGDTLNIDFVKKDCIKLLVNKMKNKITDEEIFMKLLYPEDNITFEQAIEEAYNAGNIPEKYSTVKELAIKSEGMTEVEAEEYIATMRQEYFSKTNEIDVGNINPNNIKIITPEGETFNLNDYHDVSTKGYTVPIEVKDYTFRIEYAGINCNAKVRIKPYELVAEHSKTNSEQGVYALDVKNKSYLTIESAKVNMDGHEINVESNYLGDEDGYNYLRINKVSYDYRSGILTRSLAPMLASWVSFKCNEGIVEGYAIHW